jgi:hypothetical protein
MYWLRRSAAKQPRCSLGLGAEDATSLVQAQTAILSRLRSMLAGPTEPKIRRTTIRSRSGVPILRADIIFDFYSQPQYRRGAVYPVRGVYYSFRSSRDGRVYTLECWPDLRYGAYFDRALDDLARSISL